jgi:hypothetical protein
VGAPMGRTTRRDAMTACLLAWISCGFPAIAWAQATPPRTASASLQPSRAGPRPTPPKWRISFRVGGTLVNRPSTGTSALPAAELPENLDTGFSSRQVPTWFFGDGAALLNTVLTHRGAMPFVPIDSVLTSAAIARHDGPAFGVTLSKDVGRRYRLEVSIDGAQSAPAFTSSARAALEMSRANFASAWTSLFAEPFFQNVSVSATNAVAEGGTIEWLATGAVDITLRSRPHSTWYATVGGGFVADTRTGPTATLVGQLAFQTPFQLNTGPIVVPYRQTDTVVVTEMRPKRAIGILGGGWSHDLTKRLGITADLRVGLSGNGVTTLVDATPKETQTSTSFIDFIVAVPAPSPTVFFSSKPGAFSSSLSGSPLSSFATFTGGGLQLRTEVAVGLFLRF